MTNCDIRGKNINTENEHIFSKKSDYLSLSGGYVMTPNVLYIQDRAA